MAFDANAAVERFQRGRRDARGLLLNPGAPVPTYGWQAFEGALGQQADEAAANGMGFRADLTGIGNGSTTMAPRRNTGALGVTDETDARQQFGNLALDQLTDEQRQRVRLAQELQDKDEADAIAGMQRGYLGQVAASAVPQAQAPVKTVSRSGGNPVLGGLDATPLIALRPNPNETPEQRLMTLAPGAAQPALQQQAVANELARRKQAESERTNLAKEDLAANPFGIFFQKPTGAVGAAGAAAGPRNAQGLPTDENGAPLTGDALLGKVAPPVAATVRAVLDGRQAIPTGTATKDPYWKGVIALANQVDPNYDTVDFNARNKTRQDFTSGKSAQQINAINTVVGHLHDLSGAGGKLDNTGYDWMNALRNRFFTSGGSDRGVALNNFNTLKEGVANELMRTWRQSGAGSEKEIEDWKSTIDASKSPEELQGAFKTIGGMLESKLGALDSQYKQGMGTQAVSAITPESRQRLDALQGMGPAAKSDSAKRAADLIKKYGG